MPRASSADSVGAVVTRTLSPAYLRGLGRMRLCVRRAVGPRSGYTPLASETQPTGIEIERYKRYDAGDELRFVDWSAYARLDQLYVRRFRAEREAPLYVFVDGSASMGVPAGDAKFAFAVGVALSLAYIALRRSDPVQLAIVGKHGGAAGYLASPQVQAVATLGRLADFCKSLHPHGPTLLAAGIPAWAERTRATGRAVVISDFLIDAATWAATLRHLVSRGFEVAALRPLGRGERDPAQLFRRARVYDCETRAVRAVTLTRENLQRYQRTLEQHLDEVRAACRRHGALFAVCDTAAGLQPCMADTLPRAGLLR